MCGYTDKTTNQFISSGIEKINQEDIGWVNDMVYYGDEYGYGDGDEYGYDYGYGDDNEYGNGMTDP